MKYTSHVFLFIPLLLPILGGCNNSQPEEKIYPFDYRITAKKGSNSIKVLQLTDPQVAYEDQLEGNIYKYIHNSINETNPDLIIITGDIVYGRFDNDGVLFKTLVDKIDSYNIPWAPVFGNHDNESLWGTTNQVSYLESKTNCLFKRRSELSGNGNYSIGFFINDELVRGLYMLDSKGCSMMDGDELKPSPYNITLEQRNWVIDNQTKAEKYKSSKVKSLVAMHVMPSILITAMYLKYGVNLGPGKTSHYVIDNPLDYDSGSFDETISNVLDKSGDAFYDFNDHDIDGIFAGHEHKNNASVLFENITMTYGLKTGETDFYEESKLGGTLITINKNSFSSIHKYIK